MFSSITQLCRMNKYILADERQMVDTSPGHRDSKGPRKNSVGIPTISLFLHLCQHNHFYKGSSSVLECRSKGRGFQPLQLISSVIAVLNTHGLFSTLFSTFCTSILV